MEPEDSSITLKIIGEKLGLNLLCTLSIASVDTILLFYQEFEEEMVKAYSKNYFKYLGVFLRRVVGPETLHNDDSGSCFNIFDWDGRLL